jgi:hypothetical protein
VKLLLEFDAPHDGPAHRCDVLWILKYPSRDNDIEMLEGINTAIAQDLGRLHCIVALESKLDRVLERYFPGRKIVYLSSLAELNAYIARSESIFSMRYHGVIFSLLAKRRAYGFSQQKIKALFLEMGVEGQYLENSADLNEALKPPCKQNHISATKIAMFADRFGEVFSNLIPGRK